MKGVMTSIVVSVVLAPVLAFAAGGKPLPAAQHSPPVILDEPSFSIELANAGKGEGYRWHSHIEISGVTSKTDRARLDWKQGGKVVTSVKCDLGIEVDNKYASGSCNLSDNPIKTKGAIEADLVYMDDQTDKEYLVRTFKLNVVFLTGQWESWQIVPDDTLAAAWIYMSDGNSGNSTYRRPILYITFATGDAYNDAVLRCTVDGSKKLADISLSPQSGSDTEDIELDHQPSKGERRTYHWNRMKLMADVLWGKRETLQFDMKDKEPKDRVLSDNPGKWDCALRHDGKAIRQLLFTVDKDGMIQQDEIQTGKNPIPTVSNKVVLVENRLTKDSATFDKRINPAAMKASMGFGLPWPDHPKVKQIQASYPAKSGLPDPK